MSNSLRKIKPRRQLLQIFVLAFVGIVGFSVVALAVCGQNDDRILLYNDGHRITSSDFLIVSNSNGEGRIDSFCVEGECFSRNFSGDISGVYFVQITDQRLLQAINEAITRNLEAVRAGNQGISSYPDVENNYLNQYLKGDKDIDNQLTPSLDSFPRHSFLDINTVKNDFTPEKCSYTREIRYDVAQQKILSVSSSQLKDVVNSALAGSALKVIIPVSVLVAVAAWYFVRRARKSSKTGV